MAAGGGMSGEQQRDEIAAAEGYEALLVPALFDQWPGRLLDAVRVRPGDRVLDVACGTGVLAREAAHRVGQGGAVAGVDASAAMLAVARRLAPAIQWRLGNAESLPHAEASFDVAASQFGMMFFADRVQATREMLRVVVPGGRVAVAVWDSLESCPAYADEVALLERRAGAAAADAMRMPFALGNRSTLETAFTSAGATAVSISSHPGTARFPSVRAMVEADLRGWLPMVGIPLDESLIREILAEAEIALGRYVTAEGTVAFDLSAHILTCTRP